MFPTTSKHLENSILKLIVNQIFIEEKRRRKIKQKNQRRPWPYVNYRKNKKEEE